MSNINAFTLLFNQFAKALLVPGIFGHAIYARCTQDEHTITIKEKYMFVDHVSSKLQIVTTNNQHYKVVNSIWYLHFTSPELWTQLEKGKTYTVRSFGSRIPILNEFPTIISIKQE